MGVQPSGSSDRRRLREEWERRALRHAIRRTAVAETRPRRADRRAPHRRAVAQEDWQSRTRLAAKAPPCSGRGSPARLVTRCWTSDLVLNLVALPMRSPTSSSESTQPPYARRWSCRRASARWPRLRARLRGAEPELPAQCQPKATTSAGCPPPAPESRPFWEASLESHRANAD